MKHIKCIDDQSMMYNDIFFKTLCGDFLLYISIDKNVLIPAVVQTTWDEGIMTLTE